MDLGMVGIPPLSSQTYFHLVGICVFWVLPNFCTLKFTKETEKMCKRWMGRRVGPGRVGWGRGAQWGTSQCQGVSCNNGREKWENHPQTSSHPPWSSTAPPVGDRLGVPCKCDCQLFIFILTLSFFTPPRSWSDMKRKFQESCNIHWHGISHIMSLPTSAFRKNCFDLKSMSWASSTAWWYWNWSALTALL